MRLRIVGILQEWAILRTRKKFWLPPIVLMLGIVGAFIVIAKGAVASRPSSTPFLANNL